MRILIDTREPWPHPWTPFFTDEVTVERGTLETGDVALAALPDAAVVERKTVSDLAGCIGTGRERFERELRRGRYCGRLMVIVEGTLAELLRQRRGLSEASILGSLAAWQRRFGTPFCFAGTPEIAARITDRFLVGQINEAERTLRAVRRAFPKHTASVRSHGVAIRQVQAEAPTLQDNPAGGDP